MYGFVKNKLVPEATNETTLIHQIKNIQTNQEVSSEKIRYYDATIGTPDEGRSHQLVVQGIKNFLIQNQQGV